MKFAVPACAGSASAEIGTMDSRDCAPTDLPVNDGGLLGSGVGVDFTGLVRTRRPQKHQALVSPAFLYLLVVARR